MFETFWIEMQSFWQTLVTNLKSSHQVKVTRTDHCMVANHEQLIGEEWHGIIIYNSSYATIQRWIRESAVNQSLGMGIMMNSACEGRDHILCFAMMGRNPIFKERGYWNRCLWNRSIIPKMVQENVVVNIDMLLIIGVLLKTTAVHRESAVFIRTPAPCTSSWRG